MQSADLQRGGRGLYLCSSRYCNLPSINCSNQLEMMFFLLKRNIRDGRTPPCELHNLLILLTLWHIGRQILLSGNSMIECFKNIAHLIGFRSPVLKEQDDSYCYDYYSFYKNKFQFPPSFSLSVDHPLQYDLITSAKSPLRS